MPQANHDLIKAFMEDRRIPHVNHWPVIHLTKVAMLFPHPRGGSKFAEERRMHYRLSKKLKKAKERLELYEMLTRMQSEMDKW